MRSFLVPLAARVVLLVTFVVSVVACATLPPTKTLQADDLRTLAGKWTGTIGYSQGDYSAAWPSEMTIRDDGLFTAILGDPPQYRLTGTLSIADGRVRLSTRTESGDLTLHEGDGQRTLIGQALNRTAKYTATYTFRLTYPSRLESDAGKQPAKGPVSLGPSAQRAFEEYKTDRKYTHFKAFAAGPSGPWGRAWGHQSATGATERALSECRKRGMDCEVYAVGDIVVAGMSANEILAVTGRYVEQYGAIAAAGSPVTYTGVIATEQQGHQSSWRVTFTVVRGIGEVSGGWITEDGRISGVIKGTFSNPNQAMIQISQQHPCRAEFTGVATISSDGATLGGSYTGPDCNGHLLKATFTAVRQ